MNQLVIEFLNDFIKEPYSSDMHDKYWKNLPDVSIKETVKYIFDKNLSENFIAVNLFGNFGVKEGDYLVKLEDGNFELFHMERGIKHDAVTFDCIEEAFFEYVDIIFNSYGVAASDSIING